jgi:hypothetical protein
MQAGTIKKDTIMFQVALETPERARRADQFAHNRRAAALVSDPQKHPALLEATAVHPAPIWISIAAFAWFVIAAWIGFAGDREAAVLIFMVGFITAMLLGLLAGGGWYSRNITPERRITGREAMLQIAGLPVILSIGGTIIIALAVWCGVGG